MTKAPFQIEPAMTARLRREIYLSTARAVLSPAHRAAKLQPRLRALSEQLLATLPEGAQRPRGLPELDGDTITPDQLTHASLDLCRPVVIRGFARSAPAVQRWSRAHLLERLGASPCTVANLADTAEYGFSRSPLEQMSFSAYLERMADEPLYLHSSTELYAAQPSLLDDICLGDLQRRLLGPQRFFEELVAAQLFVGGAHVFSRLHHAVGGNFFLQVVGRKRWTLVSPDYTPHLMPQPARPFLFSYSGFGGYRKRREQGTPLGLLERVPRFEVTLKPGDLLYNAPWWWHEVENLDDFTVGSATRHIPPPGQRSPSWRNHGLLTVLSAYPPRRAMMLALSLYRRLIGAEEPLIHALNRQTTARVREGLRAARTTR